MDHIQTLILYSLTMRCKDIPSSSENNNKLVASLLKILPFSLLGRISYWIDEVDDYFGYRVSNAI